MLDRFSGTPSALADKQAATQAVQWEPVGAAAQRLSHPHNADNEQTYVMLILSQISMRCTSSNTHNPSLENRWVKRKQISVCFSVTPSPEGSVCVCVRESVCVSMFVFYLYLTRQVS